MKVIKISGKKYFLLVIGLIIVISIQSFGQNKKKFFFDEFNISINRTNLKNENTEDRFGFGFGIYHSFMSDKKINLIFGFEFNRTRQFKIRMYEGHFAHSSDLTYKINCLSIPIGVRYNLGHKIKIFVEAGGYADLILSSHRKGTMHTYPPYKGIQISEIEV
jgi:hypothetical protein